MNSGIYVSASSLRLLQDCPRAFAFRHIAGHKPEDIAPALVLGRACHAAIALWYERLRDGAARPSVEELIQVAVGSIDEAERGTVPIARDEDDEFELAAEATRLLQAFVAATPFEPRQVLAVELPFTVRVGHHPITGEQFDFEESIAGVIDLVVENDDGIMVIDHKIAKRMPPLEGGLDLQLALYAIAVEELFRPERVRLAHQVLTRTKVPRLELREIARSPNDTAEALEAVRSGVELIHVAVGHPRPARLLGRHRSWRCGGCGYRRRCAEDRT